MNWQTREWRNDINDIKKYKKDTTNDVWTKMANYLCSHQSFIFCLFPICWSSRELDTTMTLGEAREQSVATAQMKLFFHEINL